MEIRKEFQLIISDNTHHNILLLKFQGYQKLRLPKATINDGDSDLEAIKRLLRKMTNLSDITIGDIVHRYSWVDRGKGVIHFVSVYPTKSSIFEPITTTPDGDRLCDGYLWLHPTEAIPRMFLKEEKNAIEKWRTYLNV